MKKFDLYEYVVHFLFGAVIGALIGFGLFAPSGRFSSQSMWSTKAAWIFIGRGALLGGVFFSLKGSLCHW